MMIMWKQLSDAIVFPFSILSKRIEAENCGAEVENAVRSVCVFIASVCLTLSYGAWKAFTCNHWDFFWWYVVGAIIFLFSTLGTVLLLGKVKNLCLSLSPPKSPCQDQVHNCIDVIRDALAIKEFPDTKLVVKSLLMGKPFREFVIELHSCLARKPEPLDEILCVANATTGGRFQCVVSNTQYYKGRFGEKNVNDMILYFAKHCRLAEKNQFTRIFSLPLDNCGSCLLDESERLNFLHYIFANYFAGVETYILQVFPPESGQKGRGYLNDYDYVISQVFEQGKMVNKLFFSYAVDEADPFDDDKVLCSTDDFLLNLMQNDFFDRIRKCQESVARNPTCLKISDVTHMNWHVLATWLGSGSKNPIEAATIETVLANLETIMTDHKAKSDKASLSNFDIAVAKLNSWRTSWRDSLVKTNGKSNER